MTFGSFPLHYGYVISFTVLWIPDTTIIHNYIQDSGTKLSELISANPITEFFGNPVPGSYQNPSSDHWGKYQRLLPCRWNPAL